MKPILATLLLITSLISCNTTKKENAVTEKLPQGHPFSIEELSDQDYPDNPDIGYRASNYNSDYFTVGNILPTEKPFIFDLSFLAQKDTLQVSQINLEEFIPTVPNHVKEDQYLSLISIVNQEWNRNQVTFKKGEFTTTDNNVVRIDIARNCLNSYLWEIIAYTKENESETPIYHGWFNFPNDLYHELFEQKNGFSFTKYQESLVHWKDPKNEVINRDLLRHVIKDIELTYTDASDAMYPLEKARKKKFKEIITPESFKTMRDLQSDSTTFATFTPPGFYNRADPRTTQLGRLYHLVQVKLAETTGKKEQTNLKEIELTFTDKDNQRTTKLVIGGIDFKSFPSLQPEKANHGWKSSMGIGNHTFYEKYDEHLTCKSEDNPYYAFLSNEKDEWLDSHTVGIDGPIFHFDADDPNKLHLWLLSFERHALVGHYIIDIKE